jgi:ribosomal protein S27E
MCDFGMHFVTKGCKLTLDGKFLGVTCDTGEHYQTVFTSQILAVTGTKTVHL